MATVMAAVMAAGTAAGTAPTPSRAVVIEAGALYAPIVLAIGMIACWRPPPRRIAALSVTTAWQFGAILVVNLVAFAVGWWRFAPTPIGVAGLPVSVWIGWTLLWSTIPNAIPLGARTRAGRPHTAWLRWVGVVALVGFDLAVMPRLEPVVVLGPGWVFGEAFAVAVALVPAVLLGIWTERATVLRGRVVLQMLGYATLVFVVVPCIGFSVVPPGDGNGWAALASTPRMVWTVALALAAPIGAMAIQAVLEFANAGGTPFPLDPPPRLVRTGPYAYVANPMQLSTAILLAGWGLLTRAPVVMYADVFLVTFSLGYAAWTERVDLRRRFGPTWVAYRAEVPNWRPRWRPASSPAVLYVDTDCGPCAEAGAAAMRFLPQSVQVVPATRSPRALTRITYATGAGDRAAAASEHSAFPDADPTATAVVAEVRDVGVAALARALEHRNLAWALAAWTMRLPGLAGLFQLINDAVGAVPHDAGAAPTADEAEHVGGR